MSDPDAQQDGRGSPRPAPNLAIEQRKKILTLLVIAALLAITSPASAETVNFQVALDAAAQVPPNDGKGSGTAAVAYDTATKLLSWKITLAGLTGDATAAHFHGPAGPGKNAQPVVPIVGKLASPIQGTATLTDTEAHDLLAGLWYIHTAANPGGEIRGQVLKPK